MSKIVRETFKTTLHNRIYKQFYIETSEKQGYEAFQSSNLTELLIKSAS